jgi:putative PIN family toxin of toxin-antitoxin system
MKRTKLFIFDANALISALLVGSYTNNLAFRRALQIGLVICTHRIKTELSDVLSRKKFDRYATIEDRLKIFSFLETQLLEFPPPSITIQACRDPKDNQYLELAVEAKANCIITGDKDLLVLHPFQEIPILQAADFLSQF